MTAVHLRAAGDTDVVVDLDRGVPVIAHWGRTITDTDVIAEALELPVVGSSLDATIAMSVVPEHGSGWDGRPGLLAHRADGRDWSPRFQPAGHEQQPDNRVIVRCDDPVARLALEITIELADAARRAGRARRTAAATICSSTRSPSRCPFPSTPTSC